MSDLNKQEIINKMMKFAILLNIGDQNGFNTGSLRVLINLLNQDLSYLIVIEMWYNKYKNDPQWVDFFEKHGMAWLWIIYKDHNGEDIQRLEAFLQENAQTA